MVGFFLGFVEVGFEGFWVVVGGELGYVGELGGNC